MLYMAQAGYQPQSILERAAAFSRGAGVRVDVTFTEYEDQYSLIGATAAGNAPGFDIILLDLIWTADFASRQLIDPVPDAMVKVVHEDTVPSLYRGFEYDGRLWAYPFLANFQLLYTNRDLLQEAGFSRPPSTMEELVQMAQAAKDRGVAEYPLFDSWKKQEGLICDFVWLVGAFGGNIDGRNGRLDVLQKPAVQALSFMVDVLDRGLMNPYSLQSDEVLSADVFLWGDAMFTTNWTFILGRMDEIPFNTTNFQASLIPVSAAVKQSKTAITSSVSGFQGLSVMRGSRLKDLAWKFVSYLSSPEFARQHLDEMPVWKSVWNEPWTHHRDGYLDIKQLEIAGVQNRPSDPQYRQISLILQKWLFKALNQELRPVEALTQAQHEIDGLREVGSGPSGNPSP
jgi:multiple sugar transport system substrate-binding protein